MKGATLVLPLQIARDLEALATNSLESAATLIVGISSDSQDIKVLARELHVCPPEAYLDRCVDGLTLGPSAYLEALSRSASLGAGAMFVHTHPGLMGVPKASHWDDVVDVELEEMFRIRTGREFYGSLVLSPAPTWFRFSGGGILADEEFKIDRLLVAGERLALLGAYDSSGFEIPSAFDRQVRAFGGDVQKVLSELRVAIVGCGGTGSAVAEQLVRLGVKYLILVDADDLSESNVTRVYGSTPADIGRKKVDVLADHLLSISPRMTVVKVVQFVTTLTAARAVREADVVFGCTDDNAGRLILGRIASYYLLPLLDMGVLISSENGLLHGVDCRVTVQTPGDACLVCRGRIDMRRAAAEQLADAERELRQREGYAPELAGNEPAVITFTSLIASQAVTELLERLIAFGTDIVPTEVLHRVHDREVSTNRSEPDPSHFCSPSAGLLGRGDAEPFLGMLWNQ